MERYLYHATDKKNESAIEKEGILPGMDGNVYFADSPDNALRFMVFKRGVKRIVVLKVATEYLNKELLEESFDHSEFFFQCKAWMYADTVHPGAILSYDEYEVAT